MRRAAVCTSLNEAKIDRTRTYLPEVLPSPPSARSQCESSDALKLTAKSIDRKYSSPQLANRSPAKKIYQ